MPLLRATPLPAKSDVAGEAHGENVVWHWPGPPNQEPWPTDAEAVDAVQALFGSRFGALPTDTKFVATSIQHSARGMDSASAPEDRGHTIVFMQQWRGIPTDRAVVVYIEGRSRYDLTEGACRLVPIPGTEKPLIAAAAALAALESSARAQGATPERIAEFRAGVKLHLEFAWAYEHNREHSADGSSVLSPQWRIAESSPAVYVDAFTGRVWVND